MMNKEMLVELRKLAEDAEMLGCTLLLEQRANLIEYATTGKIKASLLYDYSDADCAAQIRSQLDQISNSLRQEWEPEFRRVTPALQSLNWTIKFCYTGVEVTDEDGEIVCYPYDGEGIQALSDDISDFLLAQHAEAFESSHPEDDQKPIYNQGGKSAGNPDVAKNDTEESEQPDPAEYVCLAVGMHIVDLDRLLLGSQQDHCSSHQCQGCNNRHCQQDHQLIESLWYHINEEERQKLMQSLSPEKQAELKNCLNRK